MAGKVKWDGDKVKASIDAEMKKRLSTCGLIGANEAKTLISIDGTGVDEDGNLVYGANPSSPGEPPHKQRGRLIGSVAWEVVGKVARVGTNIKYGRWLELGTSRMAPRPWLRRMLREKQDLFRRILTAPMKGSK